MVWFGLVWVGSVGLGMIECECECEGEYGHGWDWRWEMGARRIKNEKVVV